jgi:S-adenosylmethionine:tRNA ribosyltransferase-isomerase
MRTADFDFALPDRLIAQHPAARRDKSRLLVLDRASGRIAHRPAFHDLVEYLRAGDVLVLNNSRVIPARLRGRKKATGAEIEVLLVEEEVPNRWWTLLRPGKRVRAGTEIHFGVMPRDGVELTAVVRAKDAEGHYFLEFSGDNVRHALEVLGEIPLPPYITRSAEPADRERYQTVFARADGSVAAPTAGLHFTEDLLHDIHERGVEIHYVTLHVGLGTFAPVKVDSPEQHVLHEEQFELAHSTATSINAAKASGRRVIAVGTTTVRVLETVAKMHSGGLLGTQGRTRIFIYPPFRFQIVDVLLTNFHLPQSTLLMLVSAFASPERTHGRELVLGAYAEAVRHEYRFFSYGDAMLIL